MTNTFYSRCYTAQLSDHLICYTDSGSDTNKQTLLLIHGFPFNKTVWNKQIVEFEKEYRVISYDIRGFGESQAGSKEFSIPQFTEDLIEFLDKLSVKKVILCGLSLGGYIALYAAIHFPKRFSGLILSDTICTADNLEIIKLRQYTIQEIQQKGAYKFIDKTLLNFLLPKTWMSRKEEILKLKTEMLKASAETLCKTLQALCNREDICRQIKKIIIPTLILTGQTDRIALPYSTRLMHLSIPGSQFAIIENAGHISNFDNPKSFNTQVLFFLKNIETAAEIPEHEEFFTS